MPDQPSIDHKPDRRSGRGLKAGVFGLLSFVLVGIAIISVAFLAQLDGLKTELASARRDLTGAKDRIARLEKRIDEPSFSQNRTEGTRTRTEERASRPLLELSREEMQILRDYIKIPPAPLGTTPAISVGGAVPLAILMPLPTQISDKVPKLIGTRFMTDRNGAIVVVRQGSSQADAVVPPR